MATANRINDKTRVLITGITGFAGSFLAEHLLQESGMDVHGLSRSGTWPQHLPQHLLQVPLHTSTLLDESQLASLLSDINPDQIYHLAGFAQTGKSFSNQKETWQGNLGTTQVLYQAIKKWGRKPRILFASSGLVYGSAQFDKEIKTEDSELLPESPYASSKAAADLLGFQVWKTDGMEVIRARPFNHIGPRQSVDFAIASFAKQIAQIEYSGSTPVIKTGPLYAFRDLTDVRDTVKAYAGLMIHGKPGEAYNIGSGKNIRIADALNLLVSLAKGGNFKIEEQSLESNFKTIPELIVGNKKLGDALNWMPTISLETTLLDTLNYWRRILAA